MLSRTWRAVRIWCIGVCLAAALPAAWRGLDALEAMRQDRRAEAAYGQGVILQLAGRYDEAAEAFRQAMALSPRSSAAQIALGEVEFRRGRYDEAVDSYRRLMSAYPYAYVAELHREVGIIELRAGRPEEAAQALAEAVVLDPGDWLALHLLGHAHARRGDREGARAAWEGVLRLNPAYHPSREQLRRLDGLSR